MSADYRPSRVVTDALRDSRPVHVSFKTFDVSRKRAHQASKSGWAKWRWEQKARRIQ